MKQHIDKLIESHKDSKKTTKYIFTCSVDEFQNLQKLMADEYKIKDTPSGMWHHVVTEDGNSYREGIVKFRGFNLNVYCSSKIVAGYTISKMNGLPLIYMDIFKNDK